MGAKNLHSFWDGTVVRALGDSADEIAAKLEAQITPRKHGYLAALLILAKQNEADCSWHFL
jgi:hypothetical protein